MAKRDPLKYNKLLRKLLELHSLTIKDFCEDCDTCIETLRSFLMDEKRLNQFSYSVYFLTACELTAEKEKQKRKEDEPCF